MYRTKKLSKCTVCKALPYIMKKKKTSLSMRQRPPAAKLAFFMLGLQFLLKPFHCEGQDGFFNIKRTQWTRLFQGKKTSEGAQPGLSGNRTFTNCPRIFGDFHISDIFFVLLFPELKKKNILSKSQLKNPSVLYSYRWSQECDCLQSTVHKSFSDQNYENN